MPYITPELRFYFDQKLLALLPHADTWTPGELNYVITRLVVATEPDRYSDYNMLLGVLEAVKLELYRRMVAPYEDRKCAEHGDVFLSEEE